MNTWKACFTPLIAFLCLPLFAQEKEMTADDAKKLQQEVLDNIKDVEKIIQRLAEKLKPSQPENAQKLLNAWDAIKNKLIKEEMEEIIKSIEQGHYNKARNKADEVYAKLQEILDILTNVKRDPTAESSNFPKLKNELNELIKAQEKLNKQIEDMENKATPGLKQLQKDLEEAEKKQSDLLKGTSRVPDQNMENEIKKLRDELRSEKAEDPNLKENVEKMAAKAEEMFKKLHESGDENAHKFNKAKQDIENAKKDLQNQPTAEAKKAAEEDLKSAAEKLDKMLNDIAKDKQNLPKMAQEQNELQKQVDKIDKAMQEAAKQPLNKEIAPQINEAQKAVQEAQKEMQKAQQQMASNPPQAAQAQKKAEQSLQKAQQSLQEAQANAQEKMSPQQKKDLDAAKEQQEKLAAKAAELEKKMPVDNAKRATSDAKDAMKSAAESMQKKDTEQAKKDQEEAIAKLKEALDKMEKEGVEALLKTLKAKLSWMVEKQQDINHTTRSIDKKKKEMGSLVRSEKFELKRINEDEDAVAKMADELAATSTEAGAQAFAYFLGIVSKDTKSVSALLAAEKVEDPTQKIQSDIVALLEALLGAVEAQEKKNETAKKDDEKKDEKNEGKKDDKKDDKKEEKKDEKKDVISAETEIQLLIALQRQIKTRMEDIAAKNGNSQELDAAYKDIVATLAKRQGELAERISDVVSRVGQ